MYDIRYDTVIFDFDGTLANTSEDVWLAIEYAAWKVGSGIPLEIRSKPSNLGLSKREIFDELHPRVSIDMFNIFENEINRYYRDVCTYQNTHLYPGIEDLLKYLNKWRVPCYIVTLKSIKPLEKILYLKKWEHYFIHWFSPDSIKDSVRAKSELIRRLLEKLKDNCNPVYIGDTYTDILAARENSLDCIACLYGDGDSERLKALCPDYIVENPEDLHRILLMNSFMR